MAKWKGVQEPEPEDNISVKWWGECHRCNAPVEKEQYSVEGYIFTKCYITYTCNQCGHYSHIKV